MEKMFFHVLSLRTAWITCCRCTCSFSRNNRWMIPLYAKTWNSLKLSDLHLCAVTSRAPPGIPAPWACGRFPHSLTDKAAVSVHMFFFPSGFTFRVCEPWHVDCLSGLSLCNFMKKRNFFNPVHLPVEIRGSGSKAPQTVRDFPEILIPHHHLFTDCAKTKKKGYMQYQHFPYLLSVTKNTLPSAGFGIGKTFAR